MRTPPSPTGRKKGLNGETMRRSGDPQQILLIELINLLGLFITHARNAKGARATAVMFDQFVQRLKIIEKMPHHDGVMVVRRIATRSSTFQTPDYHILFGGASFSGADILSGNGKIAKRAGHLSNALEQAFDRFAGQGISTLSIQLPGDSPERIDQLRLAFNIIARFSYAVETNASITFRYFGRAMTVPLIKDRRGKPDPNLTLVAGLNGLSAINMRELLKQAEAFGMLSGENDFDTRPVGDYDQVFRARSLRSQLVRPLVEVNNLPWIARDDDGEEAHHVSADPVERLGASGPANASLPTPATIEKPADGEASLQPNPVASVDGGAMTVVDLTPEQVSKVVAPVDPQMAAAIATVFGMEMHDCEPRDVGEYLGAATRLLRVMKTAVPHERLLERMEAFLYHRIDRLPDRLLDQLVPHHQGLKIEDGKRTFLVGMIHPRLLEQLSLMKEKVLLQRKIAAVAAIDPALSSTDALPALHWFDIDEKEGENAINLIDTCLNRGDDSSPRSLDIEVNTSGPLKNSVFELLWCLYSRTHEAEKAASVLAALHRLSKRLEDPCRGIGFLMTDLFQTPSTNIERNRAAFVLINAMIHGGGGEKGSVKRTSIENLSQKRGRDPVVVSYIIRRIDACRSCVMAKFELIRMKLKGCFDCSGQPEGACLVTFQSLIALERESIIFLTLIGGETGKAVIRDALVFYSDVQGSAYKGMFHTHLPDMIDLLETILRAIAIVGNRADIATLKFIEQSAAQWMALDSDSEHIRRVQRMMKWIPAAIRHIQIQAD